MATDYRYLGRSSRRFRHRQRIGRRAGMSPWVRTGKRRTGPKFHIKRQTGGYDRHAKRVNRSIKNLKSAYVEVGFWKTAAYPRPGISAAQTALWNNNGTKDGHVPSRPFFSTAADKSKSNVVKILANEKMLPPIQVLNRIGAAVKRETVMQIREGDWKPNAPYTIARKRAKKTRGSKKFRGKIKPLIDSTLMRRSVTYRVSATPF